MDKVAWIENISSKIFIWQRDKKGCYNIATSKMTKLIWQQLRTTRP